MLGELLWVFIGGAVLGGAALSHSAKVNAPKEWWVPKAGHGFNTQRQRELEQMLMFTPLQFEEILGHSVDPKERFFYQECMIREQMEKEGFEYLQKDQSGLYWGQAAHNKKAPGVYNHGYSLYQKKWTAYSAKYIRNNPVDWCLPAGHRYNTKRQKEVEQLVSLRNDWQKKIEIESILGHSIPYSGMYDIEDSRCIVQEIMEKEGYEYLHPAQHTMYEDKHFGRTTRDSTFVLLKKHNEAWEKYRGLQ